MLRLRNAVARLVGLCSTGTEQQQDRVMPRQPCADRLWQRPFAARSGGIDLLWQHAASTTSRLAACGPPGDAFQKQ
jgi:hypothetical protein